MSRILGLDVATTSGYCIFADGELETFGTININPSMNLPQRLNFLSNEISRLIKTHHPDYCAIEEVIMAISGPKTMRYLSRLNGVAIHTCYKVLKDRVCLYEPSQWKSNSFEGLPGNAKKWEIQLATIKHFNLDIDISYSDISRMVDAASNIHTNKQETISTNRKLINREKTKLKKYKAAKDISNIQKISQNISNIEKINSEITADMKLDKITFNKAMTEIGKDITTQTGMTEDVCDSVGVALCKWKELQL